MPEFALEESEHVSLCEVLDRILNKGAVVMGELTISVANIDLIYLGLKVMLASVETAQRRMGPEFNHDHSCARLDSSCCGKAQNPQRTVRVS